MAKKKDEPDDQLVQLSELVATDDRVAMAAAAEDFCRNAVNIVVARAAEMITDHDLAVSEDVLLSAYQRFLVKPTDTDKGCRAKLPIIQALTHLDYDDPDFYTAGARYVQLDPVWGKTEDSAGNLRGACGMALIRSRIASPAATLRTLTDLLDDFSQLARAEAARAIALLGSPATEPLLRFKAQMGDLHPEVLTECFRGLIQHCPASGIPFVADYLAAEPEVAIEAAVVLGECRNEMAVKLLLEATKDCDSEVLDAFFVTAGATRFPIVVEFMLEQIRSNSPNACLAVKSISPQRFYANVSSQVFDAVDAADDRLVSAAFREFFTDAD